MLSGHLVTLQSWQRGYKLPVPGACHYCDMRIGNSCVTLCSELLIIHSTAAQGVLFLGRWHAICYIKYSKLFLSSLCWGPNYSSTHLTMESALFSFQHVLSDWTEGQLLMPLVAPRRYQMTTETVLCHTHWRPQNQNQMRCSELCGFSI